MQYRDIKGGTSGEQSVNSPCSRARAFASMLNKYSTNAREVGMVQGILAAPMRDVARILCVKISDILIIVKYSVLF